MEESRGGESNRRPQDEDRAEWKYTAGSESEKVEVFEMKH